MIGFEPPFDFAGDCFQVRFRRAGADHEKIRQGRNPLEIEDHDLLRFLIRRDVNASFR
jgi:hypothetical protein